MARLARVIPGLPHRVPQHGAGRSRVFFSDADYALYRDLLAASCRDAGVEVWAWLLRTNATHSPWDAQPCPSHSGWEARVIVRTIGPLNSRQQVYKSI